MKRKSEPVLLIGEKEGCERGQCCARDAARPNLTEPWHISPFHAQVEDLYLKQHMKDTCQPLSVTGLPRIRPPIALPMRALYHANKPALNSRCTGIRN